MEAKWDVLKHAPPHHTKCVTIEVPDGPDHLAGTISLKTDRPWLTDVLQDSITVRIFITVFQTFISSQDTRSHLPLRRGISVIYR